MKSAAIAAKSHKRHEKEKRGEHSTDKPDGEALRTVGVFWNDDSIHTTMARPENKTRRRSWILDKTGLTSSDFIVFSAFSFLCFL